MEEIIKAVFLGVVQGITEFLPISSSGHLVIFQKLLGIESARLTLEIFLHFGTLIPVIVIFWDDIYDIFTLKLDKKHLVWLLFFGTIPAALIGIIFKDYFTGLFSSTYFTGFMLLITGTLLYIAEKAGNAYRDIKDFRFYHALIVGLAQGLAIFPGISRSGSTITASLLQGLKREQAARYSFLLSLPVIMGASLLEMKDSLTMGISGISWPAIISGTVFAAISGYFAIKYLLYILRNGSLIIFSYYCWTIGLIVILLAGLF
ncbi:MAG: undecaprenyl-diphosphate phosphatase [Halanaerobiaceae bacterium]